METNDKFNCALQEVGENADIVAKMVQKIVGEQSSELDSIMEDLRSAVTQSDAITTDSLERYYAELANLIYFMADKLEKVNVFSDVSKASYKEKYNTEYLKVSTEKDEKGKSVHTVAENTAIAETEAQYSSAVSVVYDHAYKTLKTKMDLALEMLSTLKHILKRRIQEEYLNSQVSSMKVDNLNE